MKLIYHTVLNVTPCGKARPRFTKSGRTYTPAKTVSKEAEIRYLLSLEDAPMFDGAVALDVTAVFIKPKSAKKRVFHTSKPDGSNILKLLEDAGNGILWKDDSQIVSSKITKQYGAIAALILRVKHAEHKDLSSL